MSQINVFTRKKYQHIDIDIIDFLDTLPRDKKSIFLYGRSGSGKTHTLNELIEYVITPSTLKIIEVYNEKATTLFESDEVLIIEDITIALSSLKRAVKSTMLNANSSRSHLIIKFDNVVLVDCMGSESALDKEGILNNQSLSHLSNTLRRLSIGETPSFRETKLTMVLKDCLLKSRCAFIGCIDESDVVETQRTLTFLDTVKKIKSQYNSRENILADNSSVSNLDEYNRQLQIHLDQLYSILEQIDIIDSKIKN